MGLESFNKRSRPELFRRLASEQLDLLVIGGGITGGSIFRDAALRGARVGLVDAKDFASGTSSRSSKLIHGGLRYLRRLGLGLAWESCHERNLHVRLNKRLVRPTPFLVPLYRGRGVSRLTLRAGMVGYELLAGFRNHRWHRFLSREETLLVAPGLSGEALLGGCTYYDATVSDNRWTLENVKDGVRNGGIAMNYARVVALEKTEGTISGARVRDDLGGEEHTVRASAVVNATGVFGDDLRCMDEPEAPRRLRLSKGTHLVFDDRDVPLDITVAFPSPVDGRPLFMAKRDGCFLLGTSDEWDDGAPGAPIPARKDVAYLLESLRRFLPDASLGPDRVRFVYSGFRPLFTDGEGADSADTSREDSLLVSRSGLVSVMGGKLTTARRMAIRVLERLGGPVSREPCRTHLLSIGGNNEEVAEGLSCWIKRCPGLKDYFRTLFLRYGVDADGICAEVHRIHRGEHEDPSAEPIRAEVEYVCRHEMACTVEDLLERRAGYLYWSPAERLERLQYGRHVIRTELDLDDDGFQRQYLAYEAYLKRFHSMPSMS